MFIVVKSSGSPQQYSSCIKPAWATVVEQFLYSPGSEGGDLEVDANKALPSLSHRQTEGSCLDQLSARPENDGSLDALHQVSWWCQFMPESLATSTLPLYDNWGSNHFRLDNRAHTFS